VHENAQRVDNEALSAYIELHVTSASVRPTLFVTCSTCRPTARVVHNVRRRERSTVALESTLAVTVTTLSDCRPLRPDRTSAPKHSTTATLHCSTTPVYSTVSSAPGGLNRSQPHVSVNPFEPDIRCLLYLQVARSSRVISVLDSGAVGPGFKSQPRDAVA